MNKQIFLFLLLLGSLCSCKKLLNTTPDGVYTTANYYSTPAEMQQALNGCYGGFYQQQLYGQVIGFNFDADNDEAQPQGTNSLNRACGFNFDATNVYNNNLYRFFYIQITDCNYLLDNINRPAWASPTDRDQVEGQTLFLRAFSYFYLAANFGAVPLILKPVGINDVNIPAATQANVYAQVVLDLQQAEKDLATFTLKNTNGNGYATLTAVQALLAKVYLYMAGYPLNDAARYQDCLTYCEKVINSGLHSLNPDYTQIFKNLAQNIEDPKEDIWEIEMLGVPQGQPTNHANGDVGNFVGVTSNMVVGDTTSYGAAGWVNITKTLYDSYGVDPNSTVTPLPNSFDLRRDWNCGGFSWSQTGSSPNIVRTKVVKAYPWQMQPKKLDRAYIPYALRVNGSYGMNFPAIRYSDVLLMYAEAYNQVNGGPGAGTGATTTPANAYDAVNMIRRRGWGILNGNVVKSIIVTNGGSGYTSAPTVTISGGGGAGATATAIVTNGAITGINILTRGALTTAGPYYTAPPTVTISGGGGMDAAATATITTNTDADLSPGLSQTDFLQAIKDERRRELCFEACRRSDLIRWGNFATYMQDYLNAALADGCNDPVMGNSFVLGALSNLSARNVLFPVPIYELSLNRALTQNPGW